MAYIAMTYLEAINEILLNAGLLPVNGLVSVPEVDKAKILLDSTSRQFQSRGWNFNTDSNRKLIPDVFGNIIVPQDTVRIDTTAQSANTGITVRGNILRKTDHYDGTDPEVFTEGLYCDVVHYLNFETIPQAARYYITIKAARRFADSYLASGTVHGFTGQEEQMAYLDFLDEDSESADHNMLNTLGYINTRSINGGYYG